MHHIQLLSYQQIELDASALWRFQQTHVYLSIITYKILYRSYEKFACISVLPTESGIEIQG
jgi:hypothetical protein